MIMKHKSQWILILIFYLNLNTVLLFAVNTVWAEVKGTAFSNSGQKISENVIGNGSLHHPGRRKQEHLQCKNAIYIRKHAWKVILDNTSSSTYLLQNRLLIFEFFSHLNCIFYFSLSLSMPDPAACCISPPSPCVASSSARMADVSKGSVPLGP